MKKVFFICTLTLCLAACSSKSDGTGSGENGSTSTEQSDGSSSSASNDASVKGSLKPATTEVSGDLAGCFTVVDRNYKPIEEYSSKLITVEVIREDSVFPFVLGERNYSTQFNVLGGEPCVRVGFGIEFLDSDGNVVKKTTARSGSYSRDEAIELMNLKPGSTGTIRFKVPDEKDGAVSFRISSAYEDYGSPYWKEEWEKNSAERASASSNNWDSLLNELEQATDQYVAAYKSGDYDKILKATEKYASVYQKIAGNTDKMTAAQVDRFTKIYTKYGNVN